MLDKYGAQLSPASQTALAGRERDLRKLIRALPALWAARRGDVMALAKSLVIHPSAALTCPRLAYRRLVRAFAPLG